jgi:biopolymer transport protein ExbB/TolQ
MLILRAPGESGAGGRPDDPEGSVSPARPDSRHADAAHARSPHREFFPKAATGHNRSPQLLFYARRTAGRKGAVARGNIMDALSLSPLALFMQAGAVGKIVMIVLGLASVWCWLLIVEALFGLARLSRALRDPKSPLLAQSDVEGFNEAHIKIAGETVSERRARVTEKLTRGHIEVLMKAEGGLANLAVISSVAPFIGLFGTVWGIMASFVGIAAARDTSLAVVAPGIAEALATTAYGLAAAIPASIAYNRLGAAFTRIGQHMTHRAADRAAQFCRETEAGEA